MSNEEVSTTIYIEFSVGQYDQELELECNGSMTPYRRATGPTYSCGGEPEEPSEIEDLEVGYWTKGQKREPKNWNDFMPFLTEKQIEQIEEQLYESARED
jgi:hypothetical protein